MQGPDTTPNPSPRRERVFDLRNKECFMRDEGGGCYAICGDKRVFDNASFPKFPDGEVGEGMDLDQDNPGRLRLGREILGLPRAGDIFVIQPQGFSEPIEIRLDHFGDYPNTGEYSLPYYLARGKVVVENSRDRNI